MVDGGVFANNPAMCAYVEAIKLHGQQDIALVSLGTGQVKTPIPTAGAHLGPDRLGAAADRHLHGRRRRHRRAQLGWLLTRQTVSQRYFRFQAALPPGMGSMDDVSSEHIAALKQQAQLIIDSNKSELDDLCRLLTDSRPPPADRPAVPTGVATG